MPYPACSVLGMPAAAPSPALVAPAGAVRGVCPSVDRPMEAADGLLVRVRVPGGALGADQVRALARAAARDGSGVVEVTSRANVQVRGVRPGSLARLRADLSDAGLATAAPVDVVVAPAAGLDPTEVADVRPPARELLVALAAAGGDRHPKAGVLVDGGGAASLRGRPYDVGLGAARRRDTGRAAVELALGAALPPGTASAYVVPLDAAPAVAAAVLTLAGDRRVRELVDEAGAEALHAEVRRRTGVAVDRLPPSALERAEPRDRAPLGAHALFVGAAPVLGRLDAAQLAAVAAAADGHGDGTVRLTPWRSLLVPVAVSALGPDAPAAAADLEADLRAAGLVTDPDDPATSVVACAGRAGCPAGLTDTVSDARRLIDARRAAGRGPGPSVHVSGCGKRCASRRTHDVTLVASAPDRYDVFRGDRLVRTRVTAAEATALAGTTEATVGTDA